ncbi:MAG: hypothetical protein M3N43_13395 [Actinomycetota bacterium]|nr:hypothetical protein [Actinomycetota bacterium]
MAAVSAQSINTPSAGALTTPSAITPAASDTIAEAQFGANGVVLRVITTGTATNLTVTDPGNTPLGNAGTAVSLTGTATGSRMLYIPRTAISSSTGVATVAFSGALTGVTYELYKV